MPPVTTTDPVRVPAPPPPSPAVFDANLRAIARRSPAFAERLSRTDPDPAAAFTLAPDGTLTGTLGGKALASQRRPIEEATRVAEGLDPREHAVFCVLGFGLGHHARAAARVLGKTGLVCVFEPDLPLLRAVLERSDHSGWMDQTNTAFFDDPADAAAVSAAATGAEPIFGLGVKFVEHGPSAVRLGPRAAEFSATLARAVAAIRTSVITTMIQTEITIRNGLMNADHYTARAGSGDEGIADLEGLAAGRPAVLVAAGPSLRKNIRLLKDPALRDRVVIIAVQTVLKTLLAEGIRPHFVTALDYHEISTRFYDGLTAEDVAGITLVAEPKVNPAVLDAYPGPVRTTADETLESLLPPELTGTHGSVRAGSTVAHLSYELARHLGCDPVILTGQDLAFTDHLYYGQGASIHALWAPELGPFRTLETLEWERIARGRHVLRSVPDQHDGAIFTDEQMATYLTQFERLFAQSEADGFTVIDATEGGARKAHTTVMSLADALAEHTAGPPLPALPVPGRTPLDPRRREALRAQLREIRRGTGRLGVLCEKSESLLEQMDPADQFRINALIDKIDALRREAAALGPAYALVQRLNQTGAFNRARADRDIALAADLAPVDKQRRQIQRDLVNVRWLADAAATVSRMLDDTDAALAGAPKITRSVAEPESSEAPAQAVTLAAVIAVDEEFDSLARPRALDHRDLHAALASLAGAVDRAVVLSADPARTARALGDPPTSLIVEHAPLDLTALREHRRSVARARVWAPGAWRGGIGGATVYDELIDPVQLRDTMRRFGLTGAVLLGEDWADADPALARAVTERFREDPSKHRVVFTQAAPGLAPAVLGWELAAEFAGAQGRALRWSSVGSVMGYMPFNPLADPITKPLCVSVNPAQRDAERTPADGPSHLIVELSRDRVSRGGLRASWCPGPADTPMLSTAAWSEILDDLLGTFPSVAVTFAGAGDPLSHPGAADIIAEASRRTTVHVRTEPAHGTETLRAIADRTDVLSLDLLAGTAETYERLTGSTRFAAAVEAVESLAGSSAADRHPRPLIVPRITRCQAALSEIPSFYDHWLMRAGAAVIDPLPRRVPGERLEPLELPPAAADRLRRSVLVLRADGAAVTGLHDSAAGDAVADAARVPPTELWAAVLERRGAR